MKATEANIARWLISRKSMWSNIIIRAATATKASKARALPKFWVSICSYKKQLVKKIGVKYWALSGSNSPWRPCHWWNSVITYWWQAEKMFCLYTSSKLSRPQFEFSLKVKVMGSNPGNLLKTFLLYSRKYRFDNRTVWRKFCPSAPVSTKQMVFKGQ